MEGLVCDKCGVPLEEKKVTLTYLEHQITHPLPCCPVCGQVYITEELASGRMHEVETMLEDK